MADSTETTPLIPREEDDTPDAERGISSPGLQQHVDENDFQRPIKMLSLAILALSPIIFVIYISIYIALRMGPFTYSWYSTETATQIAALFFGTLIVTVFTFFTEFPASVKCAANVIVAIVVLPTMMDLSDRGWPTEEICNTYGHVQPPWPKNECLTGVTIIRIFWGIGLALCAIVCWSLTIVVLLRVVALIRSWRRSGGFFTPRLAANWGNTTGFTVYFSFGVVPARSNPLVEGTSEGNSEGVSTVNE